MPLLIGISFVTNAQNNNLQIIEEDPDSLVILPWFDDEEMDIDSLNMELEMDSLPIVPPRKHYPMTIASYRPIVYDTYHVLKPLEIKAKQREDYTGDAFYWLDDMLFNEQLLSHARQNFIVYNPKSIKYNVATLPEPPKDYKESVDANKAKIVLKDNMPTIDKSKAAKDIGASVDRKNWLYSFTSTLQFSQGYVSPNWYQGGTNNLTLNTYPRYTLNLNEKFHPNVIFNNTFQYSLSLNNAPNDTVHAYNITNDRLEIYSTSGYKAIKNWYYSLNISLKTQLFNGYGSNSNQLRSSFMSPGEINVAPGMTYNYKSPKGSFTINASISPFSWNMKTCYNSKLNPQNFGIKEGHRTYRSYGSTATINVNWQIAYNAKYTSRLYSYTNYDYIESNWDHRFDFTINKFLNCTLEFNMRYVSNGRRLEDSKWHKFQMKESLMFGLSYTIKNT